MLRHRLFLLNNFIYVFITVRLHVMQRTVLLSQLCPSVRLYVVIYVTLYYAQKFVSLYYKR